MPRFIGARWGVKMTWAADGLLDLRGVPVVEQPVGGEVLVDRVEVGVRLGSPARARHPAGGVDDDALRLDQAGPDQRGQGQRGGRRVAAGGGDQRGAGQIGRGTARGCR